MGSGPMPHSIIREIIERFSAPPLPPISEQEIVELENRLGFALPPLLRELYQYVGNGRFGPGCGFLSLNDLGDHEFSVVGLYTEFTETNSEDSIGTWPNQLLPFCYWGCTKFSCMDCASLANPVFSHEREAGQPVDMTLVLTRSSFEIWLRDWMAGKDVFESAYEHDPE